MDAERESTPFSGEARTKSYVTSRKRSADKVVRQMTPSDCAAVDYGLSIFISTQHHHQVGDHLRFAVVVEGNEPRFAEFCEGELHHADCAFHYGGAGVHDGFCLLALEHGGSDLLRVGKVSDARFDDLDARDLDALLQIETEGGGDLLRTAAEGFLVVLGDVIGVLSCDVPYRRVALYRDEVGVVVHVEDGFCRVADAPDDHDAYLDGVAVGVVDLLFLVVEGHGFQRDMHPARAHSGSGGIELAAEGVVPIVAFLFDRPLIFAEEGEHHRLIGGDDAVAVQQEQPARDEQEPYDEDGGDVEDPARRDHRHGARDEKDVDEQHDIAAHGFEEFFGVSYAVLRGSVVFHKSSLPFYVSKRREGCQQGRPPQG